MNVIVKKVCLKPTQYRVYVDGKLIDSRLTRRGAMETARTFGRTVEYVDQKYKTYRSVDPCAASVTSHLKGRLTPWERCTTKE